MSNLAESTFLDNHVIKTFIGCFIHSGFLIENAFFNKKEVPSSKPKISTKIR